MKQTNTIIVQNQSHIELDTNKNEVCAANILTQKHIYLTQMQTKPLKPLNMTSTIYSD